MSYAEFEQSDAYESKHAGAEIAIIIYPSDDPTVPLIGAATGINATDDFETLRVEEAGEEGANEIVQGRHTIDFTVNAFWTPGRNDRLPTRRSFIGKEFTVMEVIAPGRPGAGTPVNVYLGARLSRNGSSHGARGLKTVDLAFSALERLTGKEWAEQAAA